MLSRYRFPRFPWRGDKRFAQIDGLGWHFLQTVELDLIQAGGMNGDLTGTWVSGHNTVRKFFVIEGEEGAFIVLNPGVELFILDQLGLCLELVTICLSKEGCPPSCISKQRIYTAGSCRSGTG